MKVQLPPGLLLLLCSLFTACSVSDDDVSPANDFILQDKIFGCGAYTSAAPIASDEFMHYFAAIGEDWYIGLFDELRYRDNSDGTEVILLENTIIYELEVYDGTLLVCTNSGTFQAEKDQIQQISEVGCYDLEILDQNRLIFSTREIVPNTINPTRLYEFDLQNDTILEYTGFADGFIDKFIILSNGDIFAMSNSYPVEITYFKDREVEATFTPENSPLDDNNITESSFLVEYEGSLVFIGKNGAGFPQILKWKDGNWIELIGRDTELPEETDKSTYAQGGTYTNAYIINGQLFITTTLASCRGIQRFDISKDTPFTEEDFEIFEDALLHRQCLEGIFYDESTSTYHIYSQSGVTAIEGC